MRNINSQKYWVIYLARLFFNLPSFLTYTLVSQDHHYVDLRGVLILADLNLWSLSQPPNFPAIEQICLNCESPCAAWGQTCSKHHHESSEQTYARSDGIPSSPRTSIVGGEGSCTNSTKPVYHLHTHTHTREERGGLCLVVLLNMHIIIVGANLKEKRGRGYKAFPPWYVIVSFVKAGL